MKKKVAMLLLVLLAVLDAATAFGQTTVREPATPVELNSLQRFRGFNLTEKFTAGANKPYREEDFRLIAGWGFNFVRLPLDYRSFVSRVREAVEYLSEHLRQYLRSCHSSRNQKHHGREYRRRLAHLYRNPAGALHHSHEGAADHRHGRGRLGRKAALARVKRRGLGGQRQGRYQVRPALALRSALLR
jgi:hypothetical protein